MTTRRKVLGLVGGGVVLAAGSAGWAVTRTPRTATRPWGMAGAYEEPRMRALSHALLAPSPHNRQQWLADLREPGVVTLHADLERVLPETDPFHRQVTVGLGGFLEIMRMAAAEEGLRVDVEPFPEGEATDGLDARPVARATFVEDAGIERDPLFAFVPHRRSDKDPYDTARPVAPEALARMTGVARHARAGATAAEADLAGLREITREALEVEFTTPRTMRESAELFRVGARAVDANPDGLDFQGPLFETMRLMGVLDQEAALDPGSFVSRSAMGVFAGLANSAMGFVWLVTEANGRAAQLGAGADWVRVNRQATAEGLGVQPMSQALQEFPEMAELYAEVHDRLAPEGGVVQMLARVGHGGRPGPSPRWPLEARIREA